MSQQPDHHTALFVQRYNDLAPLFLNYEEAQNEFRKIVAPTQKCLEIGIGTGLFASPLLNEGYLIDGIDANQKMLELNKDKCNIKIISVVDYSFKEEYDIIYSHSGPIFITSQNGQLYYEGYSESRETNIQILTRILNLITFIKGKFLLNIQQNKVGVILPDGSTFNLAPCVYDTVACKASKHFEFVEQDGTILSGGSSTYYRFICSLEQLKEIIQTIGNFHFEVTQMWLAITPV